jgi:hypothetical protein
LTNHQFPCYPIISHKVYLGVNLWANGRNLGVWMAPLDRPNEKMKTKTSTGSGHDFSVHI